MDKQKVVKSRDIVIDGFVIQEELSKQGKVLAKYL